MENILQAFLDAGMLNMVDEDEKLKHLQQTAQDLAGKPSKGRNDVIKSVLVALDPEAPPTEPALEKAETALKKHWPTIKAKFSDIPRQILRGILLETLRLRGEKDPKTAAIIWLTGSSYIPYFPLGREKSLCDSFLLEMGRKTEEKAVGEWTSNLQYAPPSIPGLAINLDVEAPSIDLDELTSHLAAAAGPKNAANEDTGPDPNPQWPTGSPAWSQKFAPRAAQGITEVINESYGRLLQSISNVLKTSGANLTSHVTTINSAIDAAVNQVAQGAEISQRRSELLWWRQTLYSPMLLRSYRELNLTEATLFMAFDLYKQMPDFYPQSVEFLLREAVRHVETGQESPGSNKITLVEFCKRLKESNHAPVLLKALGSDVIESGRIPLLGVVKGAVGGEIMDSSEFTERIGIPGESEVGFEALAVWILRDLQAHSLAIQKD